MASDSDTPHPSGIKSLSAEGLADALGRLGEPRYRTGQILRWLYSRGVESYDEMTDVSAGLRETLAGRLPITVPELVTRQESRDGTRKYLWRLADGVTVESVGLPAQERLTVCFSTQAGCAMRCAFCATGLGGFARDLVPGEIVDQVRLVAQDFDTRASNAVAMGQGEPFANYDNVLGALRLLNSPDGLGIGARHITVSTCGLLAGIRRLMAEPEQFTLAVSLHSAVQETRNRLMPGMRGVPLAELRSTLREYASATGRRPSLEYALIAKVNDTEAELEALVLFCKGLLCHVNLIPVNPVKGARTVRAPEPKAKDFLSALHDHGIEASVRAERGSDIDAACGQLKQQSSATG